MSGSHRPRSGPALLAGVLAVLGAVRVLPCTQELFLTPSLPEVARPRAGAASRLRAGLVERRAEEEEAAGEEEEEEPAPKKKIIRIVRYKPDHGIQLNGDKMDNLEEFYKETIAGSGGMPTGFMADLVLRNFFGEFNEKHYPVKVRYYTGPDGAPCPTDYETAYNNMKAVIKDGEHFMDNDGQGWIWLAAGQTPGGLYLFLSKAPPWGERPLALIKEDNIDEFFEKVDWHRLFVRLHKWNLWGGKATKFPFPIGQKILDAGMF